RKPLQPAPLSAASWLAAAGQSSSEPSCTDPGGGGAVVSSTTSGPLDAATRLRKLIAMSPGEIWTRVRYSAYCRLERSRHARGALAAHDRLRRALGRRGTSADWRTAVLAGRRPSRVR